MLRSSLLFLAAACGFHPTTGEVPLGDGAAPVTDAPEAVADAPPDAPGSNGGGGGGSGSGSGTPALPRDCGEALAAGMTTDGTVMIDPDGMGGSAPFTAYCDQTTAGGGWTLVWVYGFTNYDHYTQGSNAVSPRPTWGIPLTGTPTSTTIPTSPTTTGALDFPKWASLGDEVLATSDINHWVKCQPGAGSVVTKTEGSLTCQMVKVVVTGVCTTTVPSYWGQSDPAGVGFYTSSTSLLSTYYFYEGLTATNNWPTHDPCGTNAANQKDGVPNPHGQLWIRRRS
ncbi:MAG: fibrinogen-like YCDxxxxGGGW domain-containing protein [Kofleriaceae bacterium]